jgi:hypothetical protein
MGPGIVIGGLLSADVDVPRLLAGPLCLLLSLLCCVNALVGLLAPRAPLLWIADGVIKMPVDVDVLREPTWRF